MRSGPMQPLIPRVQPGASQTQRQHHDGRRCPPLKGSVSAQAVSDGPGFLPHLLPHRMPCYKAVLLRTMELSSPSFNILVLLGVCLYFILQKQTKPVLAINL